MRISKDGNGQMTSVNELSVCFLHIICVKSQGLSIHTEMLVCTPPQTQVYINTVQRFNLSQYLHCR